MKKFVISLCLLLGVSLPLYAQPLPEPEGKVILSIAGKIGKSQDGKVARFDLSQLQQLDSKAFYFQTRWTDTAHEYHGPRLSALLEAVDAKGDIIRMTALNDYSVDIDRAFIQQYDPILAWQQDGRKLSVREKGPLWLLLPIHEFPHLNEGESSAKMIWQLRDIEIR